MRRTKSTKATLRYRMLKDGKQSLYLDFYPPIKDVATGKESRREYLGMYVYPIKKRNGDFELTQKGHYKYNRTDLETIRIAEIICNNRQNELDKANIYTANEAEMLKAKKRSEGDFLKYFESIANEKYGQNRNSWLSALRHLKDYTDSTGQSSAIRFCDITLQWCESYKQYIQKVIGRNGRPLATNTASGYFLKLKIALKNAYKYGYLPTDINANLKGIKEVETIREFLTLDELKTLVNTPCPDETVKKAALFSALTGLRHSDIRKMVWKEITETPQGYTLKFTTQKTKKYQEIPLSAEALQLCGERQTPESKVFPKLKYSQLSGKALAQWTGNAGITRNITFHCFRHTFATLQLDSGTQITTIQKLLGHKNLATTMVYAKTLEEAKREAVNKIKIL